jgi:aspartyl/asparaginyl-tRNA synthetase
MKKFSRYIHSYREDSRARKIHARYNIDITIGREMLEIHPIIIMERGMPNMATMLATTRILNGTYLKFSGLLRKEIYIEKLPNTDKTIAPTFRAAMISFVLHIFIIQVLIRLQRYAFFGN